MHTRPMELAAASLTSRCEPRDCSDLNFIARFRVRVDRNSARYGSPTACISSAAFNLKVSTGLEKVSGVPGMTRSHNE